MLLKYPTKKEVVIKFKSKNKIEVFYGGRSFGIMISGDNQENMCNIHFMSSDFQKEFSQKYLTSYISSYNEDIFLGTRGREDGESFGDCFIREWKDFCDEIGSCVAQAVQPHLIAAAIAIHCA